MSLTDLKKSHTSKVKKKDFTVDEFISGADKYAKGMPEVLDSEQDQPLNLEQAIAIVKKQRERKKNDNNKPFRHATFTLSEAAIEQLQHLSQETKLAKSHIIRILINEICTEDQKQLLQYVLSAKVD